VDHGGNWLLPAGRHPVMQQWHSARETFSEKFGLKKIVDHARSWLSPE
jgi:hypothetical protein